MALYEREPANGEPEIRAVAAAMLAQRRWQLLSADELVRGVERLHNGSTPRNIPLTVLLIYTQALYRACAGLDGYERQQRGYADLFHYLHDCSWRFAADLAPDERAEVTNQTIAEIYYRFSEQGDHTHYTPVRNPAAFLWVAVRQLRNAIRKWRNDALPPWDAATEQQPGPAEDQPEHLLAEQELRARVRLCFLRSLQQQRKAKLQLWVVWMKQIDGFEYSEISARLDMTVSNVRVLHSRGLDQLRKNQEWRTLGYEVGLIEEPEHA
jgi:DNA-directed RNA polymerase specialized sigma24 family protein